MLRRSAPNLGLLVVIRGHCGGGVKREFTGTAFAAGTARPARAVTRERGFRGGHEPARRGRASFASWRSPRPQRGGDSTHSPTPSCSQHASPVTLNAKHIHTRVNVNHDMTKPRRWQRQRRPRSQTLEKPRRPRKQGWAERTSARGRRRRRCAAAGAWQASKSLRRSDTNAVLEKTRFQRGVLTVLHVLPF